MYISHICNAHATAIGVILRLNVRSWVLITAGSAFCICYSYVLTVAQEERKLIGTELVYAGCRLANTAAVSTTLDRAARISERRSAKVCVAAHGESFRQICTGNVTPS